jgi:hypothetical protein
MDKRKTPHFHSRGFWRVVTYKSCILIKEYLDLNQSALSKQH